MLKDVRARLGAAVLAAAALILTLFIAVPASGAAAADAATVTGVVTSTPVIQAGTPLKVDFGAPSSQLSVTNWVGFYYNQTPGASCPSPSTYWQYTSTGGTSEPASGTPAPATGTLTFDTHGWAAGDYAVYLCYNDGYTKVGSAITVTVLPAPGILNADFASGAPVDRAQGLAATTYGAPKVAADPALGGQQAATFDGTSDAYQFDFSSQYGKLASALTVECEFRWNGAALSTLSASAFPSICSGEQSGGVNIEVYNNKLNASIDVGGYKYAYAAADAVAPGTWYDAVATWNGSTLSLYLNGTLVASTAAAGTLALPASVSQKWTLGADVNSSGGIEAEAPVSLAASRIWNTSLTATQVGALYAMSANSVTLQQTGKGIAAATPANAGAGQTVTLTETPATGYHFGGWQVTSPADGSVTIGSDGTFTMPSVPVTIAVPFVPNAYTVHFDGNGADGGTTANESFSYDQQAALTADGYTKSGDDFAGWATTPTGNPAYSDGAQVSNLSSKDGDTITLYAVWIPVGSHLIVVNSGGHGTAGASVRGAASGDQVRLTAKPDTGYHFAAWKVTSPAGGSVSVASDGSFVMPDQGVTVEADFAANTYTVKFDGNKATVGSMDDLALTYDTAATLPAVGFIRDGYMLAGWATSANGDIAYRPGAAVTNLTATNDGVVTLYAKWTPQVASAGSWTSLKPGFVTDTFKLPESPTGDIRQQLAGLWNGAAPTHYAKTAGASWLSVSATGVVTGSVPRNDGSDDTITVTADNGTTTSTILIEVGASDGKGVQVKAATWNAWNDGAKVTDAVGKNLAVVASRGIGVIGFQSGGGAMATQLASALGWNARVAGDLGILSAYPFASARQTQPTATVPAMAATVEVGDQSVRVWDALLADAPATRAAQAAAVARAATPASGKNAEPEILLGDFGASSVEGVFAKAGLTDSYRTANRNASADPGDTLLFVSPSDRVDFVDYAASKALDMVDSDTLYLGWPSATSPAGNSWASDHKAVVTTFDVG